VSFTAPAGPPPIRSPYLEPTAEAPLSPIATLARGIFADNTAEGWHTPGKEPNAITMLGLVVSELVEATDEILNGHGTTEVYYVGDGKPEGFPVEWADAAIRLLDTAAALGVERDLMVRTWGVAPVPGPHQRDTRKQAWAVTRHVVRAMEAWRNGNDSAALAEHLSHALEALSVGSLSWGFDLPAVVDLKRAYNRTRPYRHGGKRA
jgi:hypothetical protein